MGHPVMYLSEKLFVIQIGLWSMPIRPCTNLKIDVQLFAEHGERLERSARQYEAADPAVEQ